MATTTLAQIPQKITVPANTNEHDIDFDAMLNHLGFQVGYALCGDFSGTVQLNANNVAITADSGTFGTSSHPMIPIKKGVKLRYKGGSGSETFNITIVRP
jgi:hypothetical protein